MLRRFFSKYNDIIFVIVMIIAFLMMGVYVFRQRYMNMEGWQTDFTVRDVALDEIITSNLDRDEIMAISTPIYMPVGDVAWLKPNSPVIVVTLNGDDVPARAYPLAVMLMHGVVNDTIGGQPIAVTYCALCNSPIIYERQVGEEVLSFRISGNLRRSGTIMYDMQTESWWQQFTGEAIIGSYAGNRLTVIPSVVVGFGDFRTHYPEGLVMVGDGDNGATDYANTPLIGYDTSLPEYYTDQIDPRLPAMERVLTAIINDQPIAYPFNVLAQFQAVNDTVAGVAVVAFWQAGALSVLDNETIDLSRDVGMATLFERTYDGRALHFQMTEAGIIDVETGSVWNIFGEAITGVLEGVQLTPVTSFPHFWFAWAGTYPDTKIYGNPMP